MELRSVLSVIILHIVIPAKGRDYHECPELVRETGYYSTVYKGTCYMFVDQEMFWKEASTHCQQMGGDLVAIKNADTMNFLKKHLNSADLNWSNQGVWIGARFYKDKGWRWTTGEKLSYSYWQSGQPSLTLGLFSWENCALMRRSHSWRWHDYHCGTLKFHYNYICQFPIAHSYRENGHSAHSSSAGQSQDNGNMSILLIVIGLAALVIFGMLVVFFIYRKRQKDKHSHEEAIVRFENRSYGPVSQSEPYGLSARDSRPVSNMYMSPEEVHSLYEEVNKSVNHGVNTYHKDTNCLAAQPPPPPPPRSDSASASGASSLCEGAVGGSPEVESSSSLEEQAKTPLMAGVAAITTEEEEETKGGNLYVDMKGGSKSSNLDADPAEQKKAEAKKVEPTYTNTTEVKSENHYEDLPACK